MNSCGGHGPPGEGKIGELLASGDGGESSVLIDVRLMEQDERVIDPHLRAAHPGVAICPVKQRIFIGNSEDDTDLGGPCFFWVLEGVLGGNVCDLSKLHPRR